MVIIDHRREYPASTTSFNHFVKSLDDAESCRVAVEQALSSAERNGITNRCDRAWPIRLNVSRLIKAVS